MEKLPCPLYCKRRGTQPSAPQKKGWQAGGERRSVAFYFALPEKQCLAGAPCGELRHDATASQCEWIHLLLKLLHKTLKNLQQLPERRVAKMKQMLARLEQVFMDGTERDIQRPGGAEEQRAHYSAQKKAHKVKNNVLVSEAGRVVFLSRTHEGSKHDKMIVDEEGWLFPQGITLHQDLGFTGHKPGGVNVQMPDRKPRTRELSGEQKQQNKQKASIRVKVEHAIGRVKIYRVLKDRIRMYKRGIKDLVMDLGCGLNNFTLTCNA